MASSLLCGRQLTLDTHFLHDVFLPCFLPEFGGGSNRKSVDGRVGKKTSVFLPPRAGHEARGPGQASARPPWGKEVYGRAALSSVGHGTHRRTGAVLYHPSLSRRGGAAAH